MGEPTNVFSRGVVRVHRRRCDTCIFGPNSPVDEARVTGMVTAADEELGIISCHHSLDQTEQAVCHGYFSRGGNPILALAVVMDVVEWVEPERWRR